MVWCGSVSLLSSLHHLCLPIPHHLTLLFWTLSVDEFIFHKMHVLLVQGWYLLHPPLQTCITSAEWFNHKGYFLFFAPTAIRPRTEVQCAVVGHNKPSAFSLSLAVNLLILPLHARLIRVLRLVQQAAREAWMMMTTTSLPAMAFEFIYSCVRVCCCVRLCVCVCCLISKWFWHSNRSPFMLTKATILPDPLKSP